MGSRARAGTLGGCGKEGVAAFLGNRTVVVLIGCVVAETFVYGIEIVLLVVVSTELLGTGRPGWAGCWPRPAWVAWSGPH